MNALSPVRTERAQRLKLLRELERKVLWLSAWTIHHANHLRPNRDGLKVGGHQASCASLATVLSALYFSVLKPEEGEVRSTSPPRSSLMPAVCQSQVTSCSRLGSGATPPREAGAATVRRGGGRAMRHAPA